MTIKKYLHSCILVEENGKRLLIDPGFFSFVEGKITPKDIGPVDVMVYTHKHLDHLDMDALKAFLSMRKATIVTHEEIGVVLSAEGINYERIKAGESSSIEGFAIKAVAAPHGPIPAEIPHNLAYVINEKLLHPGDSLHVQGIEQIDILALPIAAPWLRLVDALAFANILKPRYAVPIHDGFVKDFFLTRMYELMCQPRLSEEHIQFNPLTIGGELTVSL